MKVGDEITWRERLWAKTIREKQVRYTTGVIIGERVNGSWREFEVAVRWFSGKLPNAPAPIAWVPERRLLYGRSSASQHVNKITPLALLRRQHRQALATVRKEAQQKLDIILANIEHCKAA